MAVTGQRRSTWNSNAAGASMRTGRAWRPLGCTQIARAVREHAPSDDGGREVGRILAGAHEMHPQQARRAIAYHAVLEFVPELP